MENIMSVWLWLESVTGWNLDLIKYLTGVATAAQVGLLWRIGWWASMKYAVPRWKAWSKKRREEIAAKALEKECAFLLRIQNQLEESILNRLVSVADAKLVAPARKTEQSAVQPSISILKCRSCGKIGDSTQVVGHKLSICDASCDGFWDVMQHCKGCGQLIRFADLENHKNKLGHACPGSRP
jgi:hypothetical protein